MRSAFTNCCLLLMLSTSLGNSPSIVVKVSFRPYETRQSN